MRKFFNKLKEHKYVLVLILIILLAGVLRFWKIEVIPPGLFGDEVDTGYQAYSILKTGRDYFGNFLPVHFQSFGDWRVPLYIYLDTIFVKFMGLTEIAVRLPSVILGIFGVLVTFLVAKKITGNKQVALISAFLLAISSWHLQVSRIGLEVIFLPVLFCLGLLFFWRGIEEKNRRAWILGGLFLGLTLYSYTTPQLFLPLVLLAIFLIWKKEVLSQKKNLVVFMATLAIILLPLGFDFIKGTGQARFLGISIFSDETVAERVRVARQNCDYTGTVAKILHNKATIWADDFTKNYLTSISTTFLFGIGDPNPRHSVGGRGELYLFELPFLLLGLGIIFLQAFKEKNKYFQLILAWLILTPVPAALTLNGGSHALRLFLFLPWLQIVSAIGIIAVFGCLKERKSKMVFLLLLSCIIVLSTFSYVHQYFVHFPKISGRWWNYGYKEMFNYINQVQEKYDKIYISPSWEPSIVYTLFYSQYPPRETQKEITISTVDIGKYHFLSPDLNRVKRGEGEKQTLYVVNPAELEISGLKLKDSPYVKFIKDIKAPDGLVAFVIFSSVDVESK